MKIKLNDINDIYKIIIIIKYLMMDISAYFPGLNTGAAMYTFIKQDKGNVITYV